MERVLYVVSRQQPMLCGYLMTTVGAKSSDERSVEIKVDERRAERRLAGEARDPDRRRGERRRRPSLEEELHARGFAAVVQAEDLTSPMARPALAMTWQPRANFRQRAARVGRRAAGVGQRAARVGQQRSRAWWAVALIVLLALGVGIVMTRSFRLTPGPPSIGLSSSAPPAATPPAPPRPSPAPPRVAPPPAALSPSIPPVAPRLEKAAPPPLAKAEAVVPVAPAAPAPPPSKSAPARIVTARSSGVVVSIDSRSRMLVLEDRGSTGTASRLRIELAPDARVVLSERDPRAEDLTRPFKETAIDLSDVKPGDYVVVIRQGPEGKELGRSVAVTFRP